jgi:hypothetical protein
LREAYDYWQDQPESCSTESMFDGAFLSNLHVTKNKVRLYDI